jgi:hypothetical protein
MALSREEFDELSDLADTNESALSDFSRIVEQANKRLWEQWRAYQVARTTPPARTLKTRKIFIRLGLKDGVNYDITPNDVR